MKVYRFISEATVEENIYLRQVYKQVTEAKERGRGGAREGRRERGERRESGRDTEHSQMSCSSFPQDIHSSGTLSLATGQHGDGGQ